MKIVISILISLTAIYFVLNDVKLDELVYGFKAITPYQITLCAGFFFLNVFFRAVMWRTTTGYLGKTSLLNLFGGVVTGFLVNNFLPLKAGEFYRAYYLSKKTGFPVSSVLSTVFVERAFDVLYLGVLLVIGLAFGIKGLTTNKAYAVLVVASVFFLAGVLTLYYLNDLMAAIKRRRLLPERLFVLLEEFVHPLMQIRGLSTLFVLVIIAMFSWGCLYFSLLSLLCGLDVAIFKATLLVLLFTSLGIIIPSSPGAIGVIQIAFWMALLPFGVSKEHALALSFAYQGIYYLFTIVFGLPFVLGLNFTKDQIGEATNVCQ
ncbi:MAG: flippase-like domain-containing protein [Deltaproteobacteria bacterium]|nr:flippase-like domain-containing protein [Deltaproteobacteria bacterium]